MTYLELVNAVLRRLRETEANSVQDTGYTKLIGDFVNETKREVEDAWNWKAIYTSVDVTTSAGDNTYNLTGIGRRARIADVYNVTEQYDMKQIPVAHINKMNTVATPQQESPFWFNVSGYDTDTDELQITVYPTPNAVQTLRLYVYNPQEDLSDDAEVMKAPAQPVIDGAWARAISERGEDGGRMSDAQFGIYRATLADYISMEEARGGSEIIWERV
jgi:hypothetical protein